jgi:hypothetical protein
MDDKPQTQKPAEPTQHEKDVKLPENRKENLDRRLDEGVEETFPASDPVAVEITK